jgi:hypothetical protein
MTGCSSLVNTIKDKIYSPTFTITPTITLTPTLTPTPIPTQTPTATPTPNPKKLSIYEIIENCETLSKNREVVVVEGKIFLPIFKLIGYKSEEVSWKGMELKQYLESDLEFLTVLIPIGEGPNTMDSVPIPFDEKDLIIRDDKSRTIRHYHTVSITGRVDFVESGEGNRCQIWLEKIESLMPLEVLTPQEVKTNFLSIMVNLGSNTHPEYFSNCQLISNKHQMVTLTGSFVSWGISAQCNNVNCNFQFSDGNGTLWLSLAYRKGPNSVFKSEDNNWQIFDKANNPISPSNLKLTGVLYSLTQGCTLSVYEIDQP